MHISKWLVGAFLVTSVPAALVACSSDDDNGTPVTDGGARDVTQADSTPGDGGSDSAPAAALTDPQIAAVVRAANDGEIQEGQLAQTKAVDSATKAFATRMVSEHTKVNSDLGALVTKASITPAPSDVSQQLTASAAATVSQLQGRSGAAFDTAYIDAQVTAHAQVLTIIDNDLLPNAQNADLKAFLQTVRSSVEMHLMDAKTIQTALEGDGGVKDAGDAGDAGDAADAK